MDASFDNNQAHLSGFHVLANSSEPGGQAWQQYGSEFLDEDERLGCATVVLEVYVVDDSSTNNATNDGNKINIQQTMLVVLGGYKKELIYKAFPSSLSSSSSSSSSSIKSSNQQNQWNVGPSLNERRRCFASTYCSQYLYACGGFSIPGGDLDTIERINVSKLFKANNTRIRDSLSPSSLWKMLSARLSERSHGAWTTLSARLSVPRYGASAVTVPGDRYFMVIGGQQLRSLSSVDIVDTLMPSTRTDSQNAEAVIVAVLPGPCLQIARAWPNAKVLDNKVWVVGGNRWQPIECLQLPEIDCNSVDTCNLSLLSSHWELQTDISLSMRPNCRSITAMARHGCLVVAGGYDRDGNSLHSVEVVDVRRRVVWHLPPMTVPRASFSVVHIPSHELLLVLPLKGVESVESLSMVELSLVGLKQKLILQEQSMHQRQLLAQSTTSMSGTDGEQSADQHRAHEVQQLWNTLVFFYLFKRQGCSSLFFQNKDQRKGHEGNRTVQQE